MHSAIVELHPPPAVLPGVVNVMSALHTLPDVKDDANEIVLLENTRYGLCWQLLLGLAVGDREAIDVDNEDVAFEVELRLLDGFFFMALFAGVVVEVLLVVEFEFFLEGNGVEVGALFFLYLMAAVVAVD